MEWTKQNIGDPQSNETAAVGLNLPMPSNAQNTDTVMNDQTEPQYQQIIQPQQQQMQQMQLPQQQQEHQMEQQQEMHIQQQEMVQLQQMERQQNN